MGHVPCGMPHLACPMPHRASCRMPHAPCRRPLMGHAPCDTGHTPCPMFQAPWGMTHDPCPPCPMSHVALKLKWALGGDRFDLQVNIGFVVRFFFGHHTGPHACGRARVTVVTRLCECVEHSVWFRAEKLPCWLGNSTETFAVTDWISKFTCVCCMFFTMETNGPTRADARG